MARYKDLTGALEAINMLGNSRYRRARVLLFIYRHRRAHAAIIAKLEKKAKQRLAYLIQQKEATQLTNERAPRMKQQGMTPYEKRLARKRRQRR